MNPARDPGEDINYWPALIDLVTSVLIVFLFSTFLQTHLSLESLAAMAAQARQERFLQLFHAEFRDEIDRGSIGVKRSIDFLQIRFSDRVLFDSGDYQLGPRGQAILERCARVLVEAGESGYEQIQVEGHTDNLPVRHPGYPANNWELSTARAISVVRYLSSDRGLPPEVFSANGYASFRPAESNTTEEGRARNRRIEIRAFFAGQGRAEQAVGAQLELR